MIAFGIVAIAGRNASRISVSGLALSSDGQNAIPSHKAAQTEYPRVVRDEAV